ncbi:MAG: hypothetical protein HC876_10400 [Chloroflexaceae bacterium]|nr:hypothetical protein [Chloroflexaceae bacterium]
MVKLTQQQHIAIDALLHALAHAPVPADATNQYAAEGPPGNTTRRANLRLALGYALAAQPALLLVAEAPGYLGARRTGVPFTSERLLLEGIEPPGVFGATRGFAVAPDCGQMAGEQTATVVWRTLRELGVRAVGWNAYPFHPHRMDMPNTNRTPRTTEVRAGQPFLAQICTLFVGVPVVAVGNVADKALTLLAVPHRKVRHPAQGGARQFAEGMQEIVGMLDDGH